ncbi:hypothetical protein DWW36_14740 [Erysipelotrichaceae bacterium AF15-26LB]|nr:hypothetical protein DWX45_21470 [Erysipelotrichaceae bacterium AF19-24AC]RJV85523.1 hypothetical protein DWW36_14740 [Erysipelotrichaceae bacterium AF15-26LB]
MEWICIMSMGQLICTRRKSNTINKQEAIDSINEYGRLMDHLINRKCGRHGSGRMSEPPVFLVRSLG